MSESVIEQEIVDVRPVEKRECRRNMMGFVFHNTMPKANQESLLNAIFFPGVEEEVDYLDRWTMKDLERGMDDA